MSTLPPRPNTSATLTGIDQWSRRAEMAAIHEQVPWASLLSGVTAEALVNRDKLPLVEYLRGKGLQIYVMLDPTDGYARDKEAPELVAAGRSLKDPDIQTLYIDYASAVSRLLRPEYLGLAAETNLIRVAAPPALYDAVRRAANQAHLAVRQSTSSGIVLSSVQVETAWGVLGAQGGFAGIDVDRRDFAFSEVLGLSSYPQFGFASPEDVPLDYYSRLAQGSHLPVMVLEGGWTSASVGAVRSTPDIQARYIQRQAQILDQAQAQALVQLVYADIDIKAYPSVDSSSVEPFAHMGLTDSGFMPKPALAAWDELYARTRI